MPRKHAIPVALTFTLFAGLAMPAMAQQTRDREQTPQQRQQELRTQEMKGPAAEAVNHLKDAYSELAKAHASLIAGKWEDAERSLGVTRRKLEDASKVRNLPEDIKAMIGGMQRRLSDLEATITRRDAQQAASAATQSVRLMGQNMNNILATHGPAIGGGGGPRQKEQMKEQQEEEQERLQQEPQRGGGGGAREQERMRERMREHQDQKRR